MTLDKIRINLYSDEDGHTISILNTATQKKREWRMDLVKPYVNRYTFYRYDQKPTTRTHELVDTPNGFDKWLDEAMESLAQSVV